MTIIDTGVDLEEAEELVICNENIYPFKEYYQAVDKYNELKDKSDGNDSILLFSKV